MSLGISLTVIDTCNKCDPSATHICDPYATKEIWSKCDPMINAEQKRKEATFECSCFIIIKRSLFPQLYHHHHYDSKRYEHGLY
jgi:hypothetical protein